MAAGWDVDVGKGVAVAACVTTAVVGVDDGGAVVGVTMVSVIGVGTAVTVGTMVDTAVAIGVGAGVTVGKGVGVSFTSGASGAGGCFTTLTAYRLKWLKVAINRPAGDGSGSYTTPTDSHSPVSGLDHSTPSLEALPSTNARSSGVNRNANSTGSM